MANTTAHTHRVPADKLTGSLEKYLKAAHFKHGRKGLGLTDGQVQNIRQLILIPNFMMLTSTFMLNKMEWIPFFFTFWGYFVSMFSVFASMKAATYYEWQSTAVILTEVGHSLNIMIMPLFWILLWPGIAPMGWHWNTWQVMMHMITLHSVPFISTTINIAVTDMHILRDDWSKVVKAGLCYVATNLVGQFIYGQPLYPEQTDWVSMPLQTTAFCAIALFLTTVMYYGSTYLVDWWGQIWSGKTDDDEDDQEEE